MKRAERCLSALLSSQRKPPFGTDSLTVTRAPRLPVGKGLLFLVSSFPLASFLCFFPRALPPGGLFIKEYRGTERAPHPGVFAFLKKQVH